MEKKMENEMETGMGIVGVIMFLVTVYIRGPIKGYIYLNYRDYPTVTGGGSPQPKPYHTLNAKTPDPFYPKTFLSQETLNQSPNPESKALNLLLPVLDVP